MNPTARRHLVRFYEDVLWFAYACSAGALSVLAINALWTPILSPGRKLTAIAWVCLWLFAAASSALGAAATLWFARRHRDDCTCREALEEVRLAGGPLPLIAAAALLWPRALTVMAYRSEDPTRPSDSNRLSPPF